MFSWLLLPPDAGSYDCLRDKQLHRMIKKGNKMKALKAILGTLMVAGVLVGNTCADSLQIENFRELYAGENVGTVQESVEFETMGMYRGGVEANLTLDNVGYTYNRSGVFYLEANLGPAEFNPIAASFELSLEKYEMLFELTDRQVTELKWKAYDGSRMSATAKTIQSGRAIRIQKKVCSDPQGQNVMAEYEIYIVTHVPTSLVSFVRLRIDNSSTGLKAEAESKDWGLVSSGMLLKDGDKEIGRVGDINILVDALDAQSLQAYEDAVGADL